MPRDGSIFHFVSEMKSERRLILHLLQSGTRIIQGPVQLRKMDLSTGLFCETHRVTFVCRGRSREESTILQLPVQANNFLCAITIGEENSFIDSVDAICFKLQ